MRSKKQLMTLIMVLCLVFSFGITAYAEGVEPRWRNTSSTSCQLSFDGTEAECYASVTGNLNVTKITYNAQLEERGTDGNWKTKATWLDKVVYSNYFIFLQYYNYAQKGKDYRFTLVATVYVGNDGETVTVQAVNTNY